MAKLSRVNQKVFGQDAPVIEMGQFGSFADGTPLNTKNLELIQALTAFNRGWYGSSVGEENPLKEEMNSLDMLITYQLAYILQQGIAEWNESTEYHIGSLVNNAGKLMVSIQNTNTNHALTDTDYWRYANNDRVAIIQDAYSIIGDEKVVYYNRPNISDIVDGDPISLPELSESQGSDITFVKNSISNAKVVCRLGDEFLGGGDIYPFEDNGKVRFIATEDGWMVIE